MPNKWILGARPKTLPAAIVPVALGTAASFEEGFSPFPAILCLIVALALQMGVNYANDYSDGVRGNDGLARTGPTRLVGGGLAPASQVLKAALIMFLIAALSGVYLSTITTLWLIPVGLICILGAWFYTGGSKPYGYRGLGEVSVFIFFGLIALLQIYQQYIYTDWKWAIIGEKKEIIIPVSGKKMSMILKKVSELCKSMKIDKKEFYGGSITISSLGGIGGSFFTPIINYPEVAILGVSKLNKKQIYIDNQFKVRTLLPISLSYDHRIIDGAEAARFCNEIRDNLGKNFAFKLAI